MVFRSGNRVAAFVPKLSLVALDSVNSITDASMELSGKIISGFLWELFLCFLSRDVFVKRII